MAKKRAGSKNINDQGHHHDLTHGHCHDHGNHSGTHHEHQNDDHASRALLWALLINFIFFIVEIVGAYLSNSMALFSDGAHMFTDVGALSISLFARWVAQKRPHHVRLFGRFHIEVLAAFINNAMLWLVVVGLLFESIQRLYETPVIHSTGMIVIAFLGLLANVVSAKVLHSHSHDDLNIQSSYLHLVFDAISSVGALLAAITVHLTGRSWPDPVASLCICILTMYGSYSVLARSWKQLWKPVKSN